MKNKVFEKMLAVGAVCGAVAISLLEANLEHGQKQSQTKEAEALLKRRKEAEAKRSNKELSFFGTYFAVEDISYSDTIKCIIESDMYDSNKQKLIGLIPKNISAEEARVVINIIESDMYDSNKIATISNIIK